MSDIAFLLKMEGVCVISLGILCSKSKSLLKSSGFFGVTRLFVAGGSESRCSSLGKLVLAKGVLVGNRNIKDETSALQQKTPTHLSVSGRFLFELTAARRSAL